MKKGAEGTRMEFQEPLELFFTLSMKTQLMLLLAFLSSMSKTMPPVKGYVHVIFYENF